MTDMFKNFEARVSRQIGAKSLFPWHRWYAVMDPRTPPECAALHGKMWAVDDPQLMQTARAHFALQLRDCRCLGMSARSNT